MAKELATKYNPSEVEDRLYRSWIDGGYFHAPLDKDKTPYTIVMPPPNITGQLHMGHALDNTLQDILIRYRRMAGYDTLWLPAQTTLQLQPRLKLLRLCAKRALQKTISAETAF